VSASRSAAARFVAEAFADGAALSSPRRLVVDWVTAAMIAVELAGVHFHLADAKGGLSPDSESREVGGSVSAAKRVTPLQPQPYRLHVHDAVGRPA
jgi:hypothetical protein